jgi:hypothetical protein
MGVLLVEYGQGEIYKHKHTNTHVARRADSARRTAAQRTRIVGNIPETSPVKVRRRRAEGSSSSNTGRERIRKEKRKSHFGPITSMATRACAPD